MSSLAHMESPKQGRVGGGAALKGTFPPARIMPVIDLPAAPDPQHRRAQIDVSHLATALDYGPKTTTKTMLGVNLVKAAGNNLHCQPWHDGVQFRFRVSNARRTL